MTTKNWEVSEPNGRGNGYRISGCNAWLGYGSEEAKANAGRPAHELLEALIEMEAFGTRQGWHHVAIDKARAAIAKARGE